VTNIANVKVAY